MSDRGYFSALTLNDMSHNRFPHEREMRQINKRILIRAYQQ